ncbi:ERF family protein, partial [Candidatus Pacearchaeota archaeon]|nr:ERF family protein [Candidatus Pacearchaeota archaeon]
GKAITYNKRYMTKAFYCIPDDDDDGEGAYQRPKPTANAAGAKPAESRTAPSPDAAKSASPTIQMVLMDLHKCRDEGEVRALVNKFSKFISLQHPVEKVKFRKEYDLKMAALQEGES